jgi:hypothetical protein
VASVAPLRVYGSFRAGLDVLGFVGDAVLLGGVADSLRARGFTAAVSPGLLVVVSNTGSEPRRGLSAAATRSRWDGRGGIGGAKCRLSCWLRGGVDT